MEYLADRLIVTAGPWLGQVVPAGLLPPIMPERQVVGWLPHIDGSGARHQFPVVNADLEEGHVYFMPEHDGRGVKVGLYHHREEIIDDPDRPDSAPDEEDRRLLQAIADRYLGVSGPIRHMRTCRFTLTPDEHFIVDTLHEGRVIVGGGFSGHGFKFAPALGEALVALACDAEPAVSVEPFRLSRFGVAVDA
jgi:sarcosine oxidase